MHSEAATLNMNRIVGTANIAMIVLDTLRYDVAVELHKNGLTPNMSRHLPDGWTKAHAPGNFTFASHQAFFAGFLPTPAVPGLHERLLATRFAGSETTGKNTCCLDAPDIVSGLEERGYRSFCVGGVGFFNRLTKLGCVLPDMFQERYWCPEFGVTDPDSTSKQVRFIREQMAGCNDLTFLFLNISALHQPNCHYLPECTEDSLESHAAALQYVDSQIGVLFRFLAELRQTFVILCSDHGTAYGEDGFSGHRNSHPTVMTVPYAHFMLGAAH